MKKKFISILIVMSMVTIPKMVQAQEKVDVNRLYGRDRYETSIAISNEFISEHGEISSVILANGDNFPDALSGTTLCKKYKAPMLLINQYSKSKVLNYIYKNLKPGNTIYILGSEAVVDKEIANELKAKNYKIKRLAGDNRFGTNKAIVDEMNVGVGRPVFICNGYGYADALSASPIAGAKGVPIILVNQNNISQEVRDEIKKLKPNKFYIIGSEGVVSDKNVQELLKLSDNSTYVRIGGANRYETSEKVNNYFNLNNQLRLSIADGRNYPDALSGAGLASIRNNAIKLVSPNEDNGVLGNNTRSLDVFGGESVVSNSIVEKMINNKSVSASKPSSVPSVSNKPSTPSVVKPTANNKLNEAYKNAVTKRMVQLVNELRATKGVQPLKEVEVLNTLAESRSIYMAKTGEFSHEDSQGNFIFKQDLEKANYRWNFVGENIVQNYYNEDPNKLAEALFTQWKNSPGHYKNMISSNFNQIGFGIAIAKDGKLYGTQGFVGIR
ncbi:hypothetical protein FDF74_01250 [Clostridium niameyense]|uniref:SCP domain-containing protein n=1 Tax=Clostridium niameyense TaxID=1622073 RepID=A0A6M0R6S0_9CLOT|nr:cell wall-binding repeat-containing protein [Clostridium niameyense]NEZ45833.1 hypothetical protein [Clostridium niameyense]